VLVLQDDICMAWLLQFLESLISGTSFFVVSTLTMSFRGLNIIPSLIAFLQSTDDGHSRWLIMSVTDEVL
jgi:hypothetical protein